ncbi:hypothetical protein IKF03_03085, partial [Candidatus Saccharibacteria bacterium]|nr:hypothetical protein [Candidatus Saccharibacteria bacterium]
SPTQPAGSYVGKVRYTMVHPNDAAAPLARITLSDAYEKTGKTKVTVGSSSYYKLQDMTPEICNMTEVLDEPGQTQLLDIRDNKVYWATKLQDGHCWMTQNLDLDLSISAALTNETSDLNTVASWTPVNNTVDATSGAISGYTDNNNVPNSVNPGDWYWKNEPFYSSLICDTHRGCDYLIKSDATYANYFSQTPYAINGTHGHVGNYYNWSAAVASNDTSNYASDTSTNIVNNPQNSICPKNWRLPTVSNEDPSMDGSTNEFGRLSYLYDSNYTTDDFDKGLVTAPLYFIRSGAINAVSALHYAGATGFYWSSSVESNARVYISVFNSYNYTDKVAPLNRIYGIPVRCIAR